MGYPAEVLFVALALVVGSIMAAAVIVRLVGRTKLTLARLDLISFMAGACGLLSLVPESVKMFAPNLMSDEPSVWQALDALKYIAFFLVSVSIGLGVARRWYTIHIEK